MEILGDPLPRQWRVTLKDGSVVGIWADSYGEGDGHVTFEILAEASLEEQADRNLTISGTTPSNPVRIMFVVARFPLAAVADIATGQWGA